MRIFRGLMLSGTAESGGGGSAPSPAVQETPGAASPPGGAAGAEGTGSAAPPAVQGKETEGGGASAAPSPGADPAEGGKDWRDRQIIKLRKQLEEARKTPAAAPPPGSEADPQAAAQRQAVLIRQEASRLAAAEKFQSQCVTLAEEGRAAFPDFDTRVGRLAGLVDAKNPAEVQSYANLVGAVLKTGAGATLLHRLGGDLDTAERLLGLDPVDQALELVKIAGKGPEVSGAPKPITPVNPKGPTHEAVTPGDKSRADSLSTAEWMKRREAEVAERQKRRA